MIAGSWSWLVALANDGPVIASDDSRSHTSPSKVPVSSASPRCCIRAGCLHWTRAAGCTHLEAVTKRTRRQHGASGHPGREKAE